jgi:hypothetical protein
MTSRGVSFSAHRYLWSDSSSSMAGPVQLAAAAQREGLRSAAGALDTARNVTETAVCDFAEEHLNAWSDILKLRDRFRGDWVFRGQPCDKPLRTSLDRALMAYDIPHEEGAGIEEQLLSPA